MMEFDEIVVKETPGLCRCCLSEGCYKDLGSEYTWMNETEVYADMLLECFDISITQHNEGPNGPNRLICEVCITRLRDACNFKKQVMDSEKKFIDMMGRGEFRPKMLIYQTQMKAEDTVEAADDAEVEYLDDEIDFGDDETIKAETEPSVSDITVATLPIKGKRGRPRKNALVKTEKRVKVKVDDKGKQKAVAKEQTMAVKINEEQRKKEVATLLSVIIQNTDIVPFRWHKSKYMCFYCQDIFVESDKLKQHTSSKHKRVKMRDVLVRTLYKCGRIKLDVSDLYCRPCDTQFSNFKSYFHHLTKTHGLTFDVDTAKSFDCFQLSDSGMFCLQCGQHFGFFGPLLIHTYKDHIDHVVCEICGLGFAGKLNVQHHVKHMHETKTCKDCNETFQSQYALKNHVENVHRIDKLKCPMCPEILANSYLKKRHLALVHDCKSAQFVCELCSKIFTRNSRYVKHKLRVHFKEKNYTCEICGHKAFDMESLKCHMVRHDDAKPFKCEVCDKTFRRKRNLVMHLRTHKLDDVEVETLENDSSY